MNILEVVEASWAGVGRHVRGLCEVLITQGHRVTVAYAPYRADEAFQEFASDWRNEIRFVPLRLKREVSPVSDLASVFQILRLIKCKGPFDVIHGHSSKGGAIARIAGRLSGIPTVYTPHSLIMSSPEISRMKLVAYNLIERILGNWATSKMIAVSEDERELILSLKLIPDKRIALISNGVDDRILEYFSEPGDGQEAINEKPLTFGSTMRFSAQKAPGHLVEAFVQLVHTLPQAPLRLVIAGDGELLDEVKEQIEASGMSEKISLLGYRTDISNVLRECEIFVVSSLYEGFSYAILEAMAMGLPIVSTNVFGTRETIAQVPGNILVPVGEPTALARGMRRMVTLALRGSSRKALEEIGWANHDYVRSHFRQSETAHRILQVYRELDENPW
jgi:glycosyltransferase involved in cell wall biosynthesis